MRITLYTLLATLALFGCGSDGSNALSGSGGASSGGASSGGASSGGSGAFTATGGTQGELPPHGGETILPSVLTGYRHIAANSSHLFVGSEGHVQRLPLDDLGNAETVYDGGMGPLAVDDQYLFVGSVELVRMNVDGSNAEKLSSNRVAGARLFVDRGYLYFKQSSSILRLPEDAPPDTEPEQVTTASGSFYVKDGIVTAATDDGIVRIDLDTGSETLMPYPAEASLWFAAADRQAGYVLGIRPESGTLYGFPPTTGGLAKLEEHTTTSTFVQLAVDDGRALYLIPESIERRDYSSLYVYDEAGGLRKFGNDRIPQPTGVVAVGDFAYVSALGTAGLAGDPYRLGTVMRFAIGD